MGDEGRRIPSSVECFCCSFDEGGGEGADELRLRIHPAANLRIVGQVDFEQPACFEFGQPDAGKDLWTLTARDR